MHFLCLHGAGTNSQVLEIQTAAVRHELGDSHTYDFVEGLVPYPMDKGIAGISSSDQEYFAYYEPYNPISFRKALADLRTYVETDGPFNGVIAFSQGSSLASAFMLQEQRQQRRSGDSTGTFRCAVFFAGRPPYVDSELMNDVRDGVAEPDDHLELWTTHIWGANDEFEPGNGLALYNLCNHHKRYEVVHEGGHEVPGPRDRDAVTESAQAIKRMLARCGPSSRIEEC